MSADVVRVTAISRNFDTRVAVRDLSFTLHAGEVVALLGPNGAGKTTTLRMLAGLIPPSSGQIHIKGQPLNASSADTLRADIGLLTETPGLWDRLTVQMNLLTYARLYGLDDAAGAVARTLALVGLTERAHDIAAVLSKGLRQRLAIARAIMHQPQIVLLDEPTSGLDPLSARHVRDLIFDLRGQGRAIVVSTHNLAEAEQLADRLAVLNTKLLALDTPASLRAGRTGHLVEIECETDAEQWARLLPLERTEQATVDGSVIAIALISADRVPDIVAALVEGGARVRRVMPVQRSLEDVYLALVNGSENAA
jgi:ABC-2 type transport system ATP-binding protein